MDEMIRQCTQMMSSMGNMMGGNMMGGMMSGGTWWVSPWFWLGWALVLAVVLALAWAFRTITRSASRRESPLDVLKRRYAQGEIDSERFDAIKRQLAGN